MILWSIVAVLILAADRISKYLASTYLTMGESREIIPKLINFTYVENTGAAFSMMSGKTWLLSGISIVFSIGIIVYLIKKKPKSRVLIAGLMLVFAGAVGNAADRIFYGYVVDFIETAFIEFPVFNIADIAICIGAGLLIVREFINDGKKSDDVDKKN